MSLQSAPFYGDAAQGPADGRAYWLTAEDGVRLRVALWNPSGAQGTVLLFPGRTEYAEKYGRAAADFAQRGYCTLAIDWRGQGLADRLLPDTMLGHVGRFADYQLDVLAMTRAAEALGLPRPISWWPILWAAALACAPCIRGWACRQLRFQHRCGALKCQQPNAWRHGLLAGLPPNWARQTGWPPARNAAPMWHQSHLKTTP